LSEQESLASLITRARACTLCAAELQHEPRPVFRVTPTARMLIVGQAPGSIVHATGIPWNDRSGDRLRDWTGLDRETFYDATRIAIIPMGLCYPGVDAHGGDKPPIPRCAPTWHPQFRPHLKTLRLTLLVGSYAQKFYLGRAYRGSLRDTVAAWRDVPREFLPLPHPSWRNTAWLKRNPWFEAELVPELRIRVRASLAG
jgi:uracil-DNA glycosylase